MTRHRALPSTMILALALLCLGSFGGVPAARGEILVPNQEFLDSHLPEIQELAETAEKEDLGPREAMESLRRILVTRARAERDLHEIEPRSSLNAIATLDAYDDQAVLALYAVTHAYAKRDTVIPPENYLIRFQNLLGNAPELGNSPVGFMVLGMTGLILASADSLSHDPTLDPAIVAKTAVQMSLIGTELFRNVYTDALADPTVARNSGQFYRGSVLMRLRCPKDGGNYQLNTMKNRVDDLGDIYNLNYVECMVCGESRVIEFRQELASRLNRMMERQDLEPSKKQRQTRKGVDP